MKIKKVVCNNRKKCFEITTANGRELEFPYSKLRNYRERDPIIQVYSDPELASQGFTFHYESGQEDSIVIDQVLEYNRDPDYMRDMMLYQMSLQAQKLLKQKGISKREVMRRMGTSSTQFYRLIDQTFYGKTVDQMIRLLAALDCEVEFSFKKAA